MPTPERNAPCPCGSGKKYKQCCMRLQPRTQTSAPLRMRQVVALSSKAGASALSAAPQEKSSLSNSGTQSASSNPKAPSYDHLMKRVFGAAVEEPKEAEKEEEKPSEE